MVHTIVGMQNLAGTFIFQGMETGDSKASSGPFTINLESSSETTEAAAADVAS